MSTTDPRIEAAAKALHNAHLGEWERMSDDAREYWREEARHVLAAADAVAEPTTLPSVEDVARAINSSTAMRRQVEAVLALHPGRTESEVKAKALREAADTLRAEGKAADAWYAGWLDDRADRTEKEDA